MTEHVDAPDGERHEPKGADSASIGEVYVSDGANSGTWTKLAAIYSSITDAGGYFSATSVEDALAEIKIKEAGGWGLYVDDGSSSPTITTTASKLAINGLSTRTNTDNLPLEMRGLNELWDTVGDKITPKASGDAYTARISVPVTAETGSPTLVEVQLDIGGAATPTNVIDTFLLPVLAVAPFTLASDVSFPVEDDFLTNGGQVFLSTDTGTLTVNAPSIFINRLTNGSN